MRDYGKVFTKFWESEDIRALSDDGRLLALYLMTCTHGTIAGVFRLPDGYICEDMKWTAYRVAEALEELFAKGFANRCGTTKWVWVRKHLEWNPPENPNQRKAALKVALSVPAECAWRAEFMRVCGSSLGADPTPEPNPSETPSEPLLNQYQKQKQEQKEEKPQRARQTSMPNGFGISDRVKAWAEDKGYPLAYVEANLESLLSYVRRKAPKYADWDEALMTAVRDNWAKADRGGPARVASPLEGAL